MSFRTLFNEQDVNFSLVSESDFINQLIRSLGASIANELAGHGEFPAFKFELYGPQILPMIVKMGTIVQVTLADGAFSEAIVNYLDEEGGVSYFIGIIANPDGTLSVLPRVVAEALDDKPEFLEFIAFDRLALLH